MKKSVLKKVFLPILVISTLLFAACQTSPGSGEKPQDFVLTIFETTDTHGALLPYDFINDKDSPTSLAQVYSLIKEARAVEGQEVLLLDNGDILQGQPIVYYSNFEDVNNPHVASEVMNYMGYDAGSVGNHDIEAGHAVYDKLVKELDFPWLAANVVDKKSGEPYFEPYTIINRKGAKIAILGLCTPGVPTWLPVNLWEGMEFKGMVETAKLWIPKIQAEENPDLIIGLFHAGTDFEYSGYSADDVMNPNASLLVAEQVPGFDIIFTGHDHQTHNDWVENSDGGKVLILGSLNAARAIASAEIDMDYNEETGLWKKTISGSIIEGEELVADPDFINQFASVKEEIKSYVNKPIGTFTSTISTRESMFGDSAFVDLIHRIQLEITGADVSFAAPLSLDASISEGEVYVRDMFNLYKYENLLYTMELTGKEIKDFLEYSYAYWFSTMEGPSDHLINYKRDADGNMIWNERYSTYDTATRYYNYDSAAGIDYTVDVSKPEGSRVEISGFSDGKAFVEGEKYKVAINSYRATGGGGHLTKGAGIKSEDLEGLTLTSTDKDLRYYLLKWIEGQGTVTPSAIGNWSVVPVDWWETAKEVDYKILFEGAK
ncbi:MAG: bifunctional metallophosphatase/5'-nucleotidase [Spirochaetaceae bacterium]|nr:bifunctional metallophosphatase/5'-nucleotidase [Spirochaetaceae bacterium]